MTSCHQFGQFVTVFHVEKLLNGEILDSRNAKCTNKLFGELVKTHKWEIRVDALQDQPGVHGTGGKTFWIWNIKQVYHLFA